MATGLLGGVLPYIYSRADALKRTLGDVVSNPMASTEQVVNNANDRARYLNQLNAQVASQGVKGLMSPQGQELARLYADAYNPVGMTAKDLGYRGSHLAPNAKTYGATLDDLTSIMPENVYTSQGKNLYGVRDSVIDHQWWMAAKKARGNPDAEVEVFRAVPKGVKDINSGDWVSTSRKYAEDHGESALSGEYEIISKKVKAKTLSTAGDPQEYGYNTNFEYPQQAALDLAQQRAALPVDQGGLGLPANNTAMDRAKAMGFETSALHGSGTPDINAFDPNLVGTKAGNAFDNYMWFTSSPESASGYALNTNQFALIPDVKALNNQINQIGKDISSAYTNKNMDKVGDLRKELSILMKQKSDIYKDFEMGKYISEGSTTYPVLLKSNEFMPYEANNQNWMKANRPAIEESQSRGFQGVEIKNVKDNPNPSIGSVISNTYATENPDLIRSRFAAFDPFRKDVATATAMGVALPDLLAQPVNQYQNPYETLPMYTDPFGNTIGSSIR